jgi:ParB family transcriptional regulator, chromosome partitioning protein
MNKRQDIRSRVLAQITGGIPSSEGREREAGRIKAHIAVVGEQVKEGFATRVEKLEAERAAGMVLLRLDPKTIGTTEFANRHVLSLSANDPKFKRLKDSIATHGQDTPVRVRPALPGGPYSFELVEGHRRLAACLLLDAERDGFTILARIDIAAGDQKNLVLKMYRENAEREDLTPFEYGRMFRSWLDAKVFGRQGELAEALGLSDATISQYLNVADLPAGVVVAFGDPRAISLRWMQELSRALKANETAVLEAAERIASQDPRPAPEQVLRALVDGEKRPSASREEAVKIAGKVAFRIARRDGRLSLKFGKQVDRTAQRELTEEIKELVEKRLSQRLKGKT